MEISDIKEHIAPLIKPKKEDELARRFDYLVYSIDLGLLQSKNVQTPVNIVVQTAEQLSAKYSITDRPAGTTDCGRRQSCCKRSV